MPSYLDQILAGNAASQQRSTRRRSSIQDLLTAVTPPPAQAATPVGGGGAAHAMGDGHGHDTQKEVSGLNAEFSGNLQRLIADSGGRIKLGSGYRSMADQQVLYDRYRSGDPRQKAPAAKPGKSNHNHGLAGDLQYADKSAREFAHANAAKYGLRFPMSYEPWHIEPINAREIRKASGR